MTGIHQDPQGCDWLRLATPWAFMSCPFGAENEIALGQPSNDESLAVWSAFEKGATVGHRGSEDGIILRDEEHELGARITLERDCQNGAPFAVTCGIYGWFFHTRLLSSEAEAEFSAMRDGLAAIIDLIPRVDEPGDGGKTRAACDAISAFVERFPT
jgi:hypothetical protein